MAKVEETETDLNRRTGMTIYRLSYQGSTHNNQGLRFFKFHNPKLKYLVCRLAGSGL